MLTLLMREKRHFSACSICDAKFAAKHNLNSHIRKVHDKIKPFICSLCHHPFADNWHLKTHIANVHGGKKSNDVMKKFLKNELVL